MIKVRSESGFEFINKQDKWFLVTENGENEIMEDNTNLINMFGIGCVGSGNQYTNKDLINMLDDHLEFPIEDNAMEIGYIKEELDNI